MSVVLLVFRNKLVRAGCIAKERQVRKPRIEPCDDRQKPINVADSILVQHQRIERRQRRQRAFLGDEVIIEVQRGGGLEGLEVVGGCKEVVAQVDQSHVSPETRRQVRGNGGKVQEGPNELDGQS